MVAGQAHQSLPVPHEGQIGWSRFPLERPEISAPRIPGLLFRGEAPAGTSPRRARSIRRRPPRSRDRHGQGRRLRVQVVRGEAAGPRRHPGRLDLSALRSGSPLLRPVHVLRHVREVRVHPADPGADPGEETAQHMSSVFAGEVVRPDRRPGHGGDPRRCAGRVRPSLQEVSPGLRSPERFLHRRSPKAKGVFK